MKSILLSLLVFCIFSPALAIEPWVGKKFLHTVSPGENYFTEINMIDESVGQVITKNGFARVDLKEVEEGILEFELRGDIIIQGYRYEVNKLLCEASGGDLLSPDCQVQAHLATTQLKKIILSESELNTHVEEVWESCIHYPTNSTPTTRIECETHTDDLDGQYVLEKNLRSETIRVFPGEKVVLSMSWAGDLYLSLNPDFSVTTIESNFSANYGDFVDASLISHWEKSGHELTLKLRTGGSIRVTKTQEFDGVARIRGIYQSKGEMKAIAGALFVDHAVNTSDMTNSDFTGSYRLVSVNTKSGYSSTYSFNNDGFATRLPGQYTSSSSLDINYLLSWSLNGGEVETIRYYMENTGPVRTEDDMKFCLETINQGQSTCYPMLETRYKILDQDGNKVTFLVSTEYTQPVIRTKQGKSLNIGVFYKQ